MHVDSAEALRRKIEICDRVLSALGASGDDRPALERALRVVRNDAVERLRALEEAPPDGGP